MLGPIPAIGDDKNEQNQQIGDGPEPQSSPDVIVRDGDQAVPDERLHQDELLHFRDVSAARPEEQQDKRHRQRLDEEDEQDGEASDVPRQWTDEVAEITVHVIEQEAEIVRRVETDAHLAAPARKPMPSERYCSAERSVLSTIGTWTSMKNV